MHPDGRLDQSEALVDLAGSVEELREKMQSTFLDGNYQWALQLSEALLDTQNCIAEARVEYFKDCICEFFLYFFLLFLSQLNKNDFTFL